MILYWQRQYSISNNCSDIPNFDFLCGAYIVYLIYLHIQLHDDWLKHSYAFFLQFIQIYPADDVMGMKFICNMIISDLFYICWNHQKWLYSKINRFAQKNIYEYIPFKKKRIALNNKSKTLIVSLFYCL